MSKHTILYVRRYNFTDKATGEQISGVKVSYLDSFPEKSKDSKGMAILTINAPLESWDCFEQVPGQYELDFRQRPDAKGKPVLILRSAEFVGPVHAAAS